MEITNYECLSPMSLLITYNVDRIDIRTPSEVIRDFISTMWDEKRQGRLLVYVRVILSEWVKGMMTILQCYLPIGINVVCC